MKLRTPINLRLNIKIAPYTKHVKINKNITDCKLCNIIYNLQNLGVR